MKPRNNIMKVKLAFNLHAVEELLNYTQLLP